ncbi:MAG: MG2 domain-containing protein [Flavobacteriales bacterium]|nr:MG2 domain-containing protein [Flavobacteriales bacterium]MDW8433101.1 MG2 domain-containing protein [Flavobacteriales bacterium]
MTFKPARSLAFNQVYTGSFYLGQVKDVPARFREFRFGFRTLPCYMDVRFQGFETQDGQFRAVVSVRTSEVVSPEVITQCFKVEQGSETIPVRADSGGPGRCHILRTAALDRQNSEPLQWVLKSDENIRATSMDPVTLRLPSAQHFRVTREAFYGLEEGRIQLNFSQPPDPRQDLSHLIWLASADGKPVEMNLRPEVQGNNIFLHPDELQSGTSYTLHISPAVRSEEGASLDEPYELKFSTSPLQPGLFMDHYGVIIPSSEHALIPFKARQLRRVRVRIFQVFDNNLEAFLREREYSLKNADFYNVSRFGRVAWEGEIELTPLPYPEIRPFALNVGPLLKKLQGKVFLTSLFFKPEDIFNGCSEAPDDNATTSADPAGLKILALDLLKSKEPSDPEYFEPDGAWYWNDPRYDWQKSEDPCNPAFYAGKTQYTWFHISDLGLVARKSGNGQWVVGVNSLESGQGLAGVRVTLMDPQNQPLASGHTRSDGLIYFNDIPEHIKPAAVKAETSRETQWITLNPHHSLNLSSFAHTAGRTQAIRDFPGFIYTERGVWRPGDTLFTATVLPGGAEALPEGMPLVYELTDPRGQVVDRQVRNPGAWQIVTVPFVTAPDAPTGVYTLRLKTGPYNATRRLLVEAIKPNRLNIQVDWPASGCLTEKTFPISLRVKRLTGAPAARMKVVQSVKFKKEIPSFGSLKNFCFHPPEWQLKESDEVQVFEGTTDADGQCAVQWRLPLRNPRSLLGAIVTTQVWEPGGYSSVDVQNLRWSPFSTFVGFNVNGTWPVGVLSTNKTYRIQLVAVDPEGRKVGPGEKIRLRLSQTAPQYWYEEDITTDEGFSYNDSHENLMDTIVVTGQDGMAVCPVRIPKTMAGTFKLQAMALSSGYMAEGRMEFGDEEIQTYDLVAPHGRREAFVLPLKLDKKSCEEGSEVHLSFESRGDETALIALETPSRLLELRRVACTAGETHYRFRIPEGAAPNVFVQVHLIRPFAHASGDIRRYGLEEIQVSPVGARLKPIIRTSGPLEPDVPFEIQIRESEGRPCTYTLAVVDEGLLNLTRFKTPDVYSEMYRPGSYQSGIWDNYDAVVQKIGKERYRMVTIGGDGHLDPAAAGRLKRFKPVVRFLGPFKLKAKDTHRHKILIENYVGSVRVMVMAAQDRSFGSADTTLPVARDVMLLPTLPRVLAPGEEVKLPVSVLWQNKKGGRVTVQVQTTAGLQVRGSAARSVEFKGPGETVVTFDLVSGPGQGWRTVNVTATGAGKPARAFMNIESRNPERPHTLVRSFTLAPGTQQAFEALGSNQPVVADKLEIYNRFRLNLDGVLRHLIQYPYGCAEQMVSAALPQLYLNDFARLTELEERVRQSNVRQAIRRLSQYMAPDGGLAYWPGARRSEEWATAYALLFLSEAKARGFDVPEKNHRRLVNFLKESVHRSHSNNILHIKENLLSQAYFLWTLSAAGAPAYGAMTRLLEEGALTPEARWYLAAAYALAGRRDIASRLIFKTAPADESNYQYGSLLRSQSIALATLALLNDEGRATPLARQIGETLEQGLYNTQGASLALWALNTYFRKFPMREPIRFSMNEGAPITLERPVHQQDIPQNQKLTLKNLSSIPIQISRITTQQPPMGQSQPFSQGLKISRRFIDDKGNALDLENVPQTTAFWMEWTVSNASPGLAFSHLALCQMLPSGWEIASGEMLAGESLSSAPEYDHSDLRDDRVCYFFSLPSGKSKTFRLRVNAAYAGRFYLPGALVEDMYRPNVAALTPAFWIQVMEVSEPKGPKKPI